MDTKSKIKIAFVVFVTLVCFVFLLAFLASLKPSPEPIVVPTRRGGRGRRHRTPQPISSPSEPVPIDPVVPFDIPFYIPPHLNQDNNLRFEAEDSPFKEVINMGKRTIVSPQIIADSYKPEEKKAVDHTFSLIFKGITNFQKALDKYPGTLAFVVTVSEVADKDNKAILTAAVERGAVLILQLEISDWVDAELIAVLKENLGQMCDDIQYSFNYMIPPIGFKKAADVELFLQDIDDRPEMVFPSWELNAESKIEDLQGAVIVDLLDDRALIIVEKQLDFYGDKDNALYKFINVWVSKEKPANIKGIQDFRSGFFTENDMLKITVSRANVFRDSVNIFKKHLEFREGLKTHTLIISFKGELGVDAGGVKKDWFTEMTKQMFSPEIGIFNASSTNQNVYYPNPLSFKRKDHLALFEFAGLFIAKALLDGIQINCHLSQVFYKHILGIKPSFQDLKEIDADIYNNMHYVLNANYLDDFNFEVSILSPDGNTNKSVSLKPESETVVNEENRFEYIALYSNFKMIFEIHEQMAAFMKGFNHLIPPNSIVGKLEVQDLDAMLAGAQEIDLDDWKRNTEYLNGYSESSQTIIWFWEFVEKLDDKDRRKVLRFATGSPAVPIGGFAALRTGSGGLRKFNIQCANTASRCPEAHTCFNNVQLPAYPTKALFDERILFMIAGSGAVFDMG